jgi:hypothetical protein
MQVIHFDQDVQVCGVFITSYSKYFFGTPLNHDSRSFWRNAFYLKVWAILFLSFFPFLYALWHVFFSLMPFGIDIF